MEAFISGFLEPRVSLHVADLVFSAAFQRLGFPATSCGVSARHCAGQMLSQSLLVARAVLEKLTPEGHLESVCPQKVDVGSDFKNPGQSSPRGGGERAPEETEPRGDVSGTPMEHVLREPCCGLRTTV